MTETMSTRKSLFEPTDLLGPDPLPTPPLSTASGESTSKYGDDVLMSNETMPREENVRVDAPPPDFEEEPSDLEDEVMAMMEQEGPPSPKVIQPTFIPTGLLDFDPPAVQPFASRAS